MTAIARGRLQVTQAKLHRIGVGGGRQFVDETLAGEIDLRPDRIAQMGGAQR